MIVTNTAKQAAPGAIFRQWTRVRPHILYRAWTDAAQVSAWWGPYGFTNPVCIWNAWDSGSIYVEMTSADGMLFPLHGIFHEATPNKRIMFTTSSFADADGQPQLIVLNTVSFTEANAVSIFELKVEVIKATLVVKESLTGMQQGWRQSLVKLEEFLSTKRDTQ